MPINDKINLHGVRLGTLGKSITNVRPPKPTKLPKPREPKISNPKEVKLAELSLDGIADGFTKRAAEVGVYVDRETVKRDLARLLKD